MDNEHKDKLAWGEAKEGVDEARDKVREKI